MLYEVKREAVCYIVDEGRLAEYTAKGFEVIGRMAEAGAEPEGLAPDFINEPVKPTEDALRAMSVRELREHCKALGLTVSPANKEAYIKAILEY